MSNRPDTTDYVTFFIAGILALAVIFGAGSCYKKFNEPNGIHFNVGG